MTKRERVLACLARKTVDRAPVSFWRHAPAVDHTARGLADAMLAFHRRFDLDILKVMSSGVYCVEDWGCRVAYTGAPGGAKQCTEHPVLATQAASREVFTARITSGPSCAICSRRIPVTSGSR